MKNLRSLVLIAALTAAGCSAPVVSAAKADSPEAVLVPAVSHAVADVRPVVTAGATITEITIPAGTTLSLQLGSTVSSRTSRVEDSVQATMRRPIVIDGVTVVPAGAAVSGYVSQAERSGRVKGRARIGVRFNALRVDGTRYSIRTLAINRVAPATKGEDATKIAVGAGAGALVGAIADGKKGAAVGSAVGGAGGTGVVLATRGREVSLGRGVNVTTRLTAPVTIQVR